MALTLSILNDQIVHAHERTQNVAVQQINYWLTVRNWLVGWHIIEYEQQGHDRVKYGERLLGELARTLRERSITGLSLTNLKLCRQFCLTYPILLRQETDAWQKLGIIRTNRSNWSDGVWPITLTS